MTNDEIHSAIVGWVAAVTKFVAIKTYQPDPAPASPYITVTLTGMAPVREQVQTVEYTDTGEPNSEGKNRISAAPVIEQEWQFSLNAQGPQPTDMLRPIFSAAKLSQITEPMFPNLAVHEVSSIKDATALVDGEWKLQAQMDVKLRGLTRDGFVIDVIDQADFDIARAQ